MSGTSVGASGETGVDMGCLVSTKNLSRHGRIYSAIHVFLPVVRFKDVDARDKPGHDAKLRKSDCEVDLLLRRGLGIGWLRSLRLGLALCRGFLGLVPAPALSGFAQLRHIIPPPLYRPN